MVRASPQPSLLLAEDVGGTVLLALATAEGGFLGEGEGAVEVSLDSTAVTLVGLTAGIAVSDMDSRLASDIRAHPQYRALVSAFRSRLQTDKNFLDRLSDDPATERLIEEVAADITPLAARVSSAATSGLGSAPDLTLAEAAYEPPSLHDVIALLGAEAHHESGQGLSATDGECLELRDLLRTETIWEVLNILYPTTRFINLGRLVFSYPEVDLRAYGECRAARLKQWIKETGKTLPELDPTLYPLTDPLGMAKGDPPTALEVSETRQRLEQGCETFLPPAYVEHNTLVLDETAEIAQSLTFKKLRKVLKKGGAVAKALARAWEGHRRADKIIEIDGVLIQAGCEDEDTPPHFEETSYMFTLLETRYDHRGGITVGMVRAIDPERVRDIEYGLASGSATKFAVDGQTGVVRYIGRGEDYERGPREYGLTVRATEVGEDGLSTDVRVTVEIEDEDELPYFEEEAYEFTIKVTDPRRDGRVLIGVVQAQDPEGTEVHHSLGRWGCGTI